MDRNTDIFYTIALLQVPMVGCITFHRLVEALGNAENVLNASKKTLLEIEHINKSVVNQIFENKSIALQSAENEVHFLQKNNITTLLISDKNYPKRLKECVDAPPILFARGNFDSNAKKCIAIVGTRHCTSYGAKMTKKIIEELVQYNVMIISGLAAGIDTIAHQTAVEQGLTTIGILGHGLKYIYPVNNRRLAKTMIENGGVVTEYFSNTPGDVGNFPRRNRIIAGMSDAILVVESRIRGGALITADLGFSYDRDVFAVPGRASDIASEGCNKLIFQNKAALVTSGEDIAKLLNWTGKTKTNKKNELNSSLLQNLNKEELMIINILKEKTELNIDELSLATNLNMLTLTNTLLSLEFKGCIECLPGKRYHLI